MIDIIEALDYCGKSTLTPFLTFLSSKLAGANTSYEIPLGKEEDNRFIEKFLMKGKNEYLYNPSSGSLPKNKDAWHKTIHQYRYRTEFAKAFESFTNRGCYKFSKDYIKIIKRYALKRDKISLSNITILFFYNLLKNPNDLPDIEKKFINEFNITNEELKEIFVRSDREECD